MNVITTYNRMMRMLSSRAEMYGRFAVFDKR